MNLNFKAESKMAKLFNERNYQTIQVQRLIVFSIYAIISNNEECTFERLVKECFTLFSKKFGFYRYPQWPDSLRLDRQLRTLRTKGWITGGAESVFSLTKFGEKIARDTEKILHGRKKSKVVTKKLVKGREAKLIGDLKKSELFLKFINKKDEFKVSENALRRFLHCTLETPLRVIKQNLQYCKNLADECGEKELYQFIETCEKQLNLQKRY